MHESEVIKSAVTGFYDFISSNYPTIERCASVEEIIARWLVDGPAVEDCRCNHSIFLSAVACIFAEVHDDRWVRSGKDTALPSRIRSMRHIHQEVDSTYPFAPPRIANIFDPYVFIEAVEEYRYRLAQSCRKTP